MSKRSIFLFAAIFLVALVVFLSWPKIRPVTTEATLSARAPSSETNSSESVSTPASRESKPSSVTQLQNGDEGEDEKFRSVTAVTSEADLKTIMEEANLLSSHEMTHLVERLKISDEKMVADLLQKTMRESQDSTTRSRVLLISDTWRSAELLPLWQDIALDDRVLKGQPSLEVVEPTEVSRGVQLEILTAIGNLGILGTESEEAKQTLRSIVLEPISGTHTPFIRERAFFALKEADIAASTVVFKKLPADDPLRKQLKRN